jgi:chromosomal replication initiation ATPase DnaA
MNTSAENSNVWNSILQSVEKRLNRQIFDAWFRPIQFEGFDEGEKVLHLRASQVNKDWVNTYYSEVIKQTLNELNIANYRLDWEIEETKLPEENFLDEDEDAEFFFEKQKPIGNTIGFNFMT